MSDKNDFLDMWRSFCVFREKLRNVVPDESDHEDTLTDICFSIKRYMFEQGEICKNEIISIYHDVKNGKNNG